MNCPLKAGSCWACLALHALARARNCSAQNGASWVKGKQSSALEVVVTNWPILTGSYQCWSVAVTDKEKPLLALTTSELTVCVVCTVEMDVLTSDCQSEVCFPYAKQLHWKLGKCDSLARPKSKPRKGPKKSKCHNHQQNLTFLFMYQRTPNSLCSHSCQHSEDSLPSADFPLT